MLLGLKPVAMRETLAPETRSISWMKFMVSGWSCSNLFAFRFLTVK